MNPDRTEAARHAIDAATRALFGDVLPLSDEECRAETSLPGWTRGHVLSHIARHAEALVDVLEPALAGETREMFADRDRDGDIAAGADRTALELLTDMDTTAHRLSEVYDRFAPEQWDTPVSLRGGAAITARETLGQRLAEVALHHVDLDVGYGLTDIDPGAAALIIEWVILRLSQKAAVPDVTLVADTGERFEVGAGGPEVTGTVHDLLGWVSGRTAGEGLQGADGVTIPPL